MGLLFEELTRCSLFNYFAQPHKLSYALIWFYVVPTFKIERAIHFGSWGNLWGNSSRGRAPWPVVVPLFVPKTSSCDDFILVG